MNEQQINQLTDSLSNLLNNILNEREPIFDFRTPHHVEMYLSCFMNALNQNDGEPVPYDRFRENLYLKVPTDRPLYHQTLVDFERVWSAWVHLYRHLNQIGSIKK